MLWTLVPAAEPVGSSSADNPPDKSHYSLFNPTPSHAMREMATDRPDQTESPYTVDAGHSQVEMDFISYGWDRDTSLGGDTEVTDISVAPINFKLGLLNDLDLQLVIESWRSLKTEDRTPGRSTGGPVSAISPPASSSISGAMTEAERPSP